MSCASAILRGAGPSADAAGPAAPSLPERGSVYTTKTVREIGVGAWRDLDSVNAKGCRRRRRCATRTLAIRREASNRDPLGPRVPYWPDRKRFGLGSCLLDVHPIRDRPGERTVGRFYRTASELSSAARISARSRSLSGALGWMRADLSA